MTFKKPSNYSKRAGFSKNKAGGTYRARCGVYDTVLYFLILYLIIVSLASNFFHQTTKFQTQHFALDGIVSNSNLYTLITVYLEVLL